MKIRLLVNKDKSQELKEYFQAKGIEISDFDFNYTLISNEAFLDVIMGYKEDEIYLLKPEDIIYFESFGNRIQCHTRTLTCDVKYKLYEIENLFQHQKYMRISNSFIVNLDQIRSIKPTINSKFILTMKNDHQVEVTRSYYYIFKSRIEGGSKR